MSISAWLDRLLGLSRVSAADPRAALDFQHPLPIWAWILIVLGALIVGGWSYRHLIGSRTARTSLSIVRAMLLVWVVVLIAGPMLVVARERIEKDWVIVLVDRSASMRIADVDAGHAEAISREQQLARVLREHGDVFVDDRKHVTWFGFDSGLFQIAPEQLPPADGQTTSLRTAIEQALSRSAGRPISGIVLLTDGRTAQDTGGDLVHRLGQHAAAVFPVPLGATRPVVDLAVAQVDAPRKAFVNDTVTVSVFLERYPDDAVIDPQTVRVRLIDPLTGRVLDEQSPVGADLAQPVHLTTESSLVGPATWRVEAQYDVEAARRELITENNHREVSLELVDRPIRTLFVEGYPRWEYRYLKNMLLRERSIESSVLLLSADREFAQEGDVAITRMPNTDEEIKPFDVIILGDVPAGYFTPEQLTLVREQVATLGAGLLWIGGPYHTPKSYDATDLDALLPMRRPAAVEPIGRGATPMHAHPTPLAEAMSLLWLRAPDTPRDQRWPDTLPALRWVQDLGDLKPTVERLAEVTIGDSAASAPLITHMHYGAGQVVYVATDELWRWRYGRGELYFEQVWMQLLRMLGRGRIQQNDQRVRLDVSHRRVPRDQAVVVSLHIDDPLLLDRALPRIQLRVESDGDDSARETIELRPVSEQHGAAMQYRAIWRPMHAGRLRLRVVEPALVDLGLSQVVEVIRPDDEMRHPAPDHARLAQLAEQTGGRMVAPDELDQLPSLLPNRAQRTADDLREPLWDSYLALMVVVLLLTIEWVGRKVIRLA
jgi:hypothetical protein